MTTSRSPLWLLATLLALQNPLASCAAVTKSQSLCHRAPSDQFSVPQNNTVSPARQSEVASKKDGWQYGPPVAGGPFFPTGSMANAQVAADVASVQADALPEIMAVANATKDVAGTAPYNGLQTLQDYTLLYTRDWQQVLPKGPAPGMLTNFTSDLLFSMERLSISPFQVRRLSPSSDDIQFDIDDSVATSITGMTVKQLFHAGRLFYSDYRDQANLTRTERFAAACDAYFYIDQKTGDFLPLAIRTNTGSNLVYTPKDSPEDWLLAKIMYNVNDNWFAQWNHLASTHEVVQIVYLSAIRSLSGSHPAMGLLNRTMFQVFAIQPLAASILFGNGTAVDSLFPYTGIAAQNYTTNRYQNAGSGRFKANYFTTDLKARGLINSTYGPALKSFPFFEDSSVIHDAISTFMTAMVNSYYPTDSDVKADKEIQGWVKEAQGPAKVIDFPAIDTKASLVDVLTHMAHLVSAAHHTINSNELILASSVLPFHPMALYQPPPTSKNATDLAKFLPPIDKCEKAFQVAALFARPAFVGTNRTLMHMFDDTTMLSRMNRQTQQAAATFLSSMQDFSKQVSARTFDDKGLSQGMPFVWQVLDPNFAPYSISD